MIKNVDLIFIFYLSLLPEVIIFNDHLRDALL